MLQASSAVLEQDERAQPGEVLGALADGWLQLGDIAKANAYLDRMTAELPGTPYAKNAAARRSDPLREDLADLPWVSLACGCISSSRWPWLRLAVSATAQTVMVQSGRYTGLSPARRAREAPAGLGHPYPASAAPAGHRPGPLPRYRDRPLRSPAA